MNLRTFLTTWDGITRENRWNRLFIGLLIIANIALIATLTQTERTVVLVPPLLSQEITLGRTSGSQEAKDVWALFVVELLGHINPANADFLRRALEPLLAEQIRADVLSGLAAQLDDLKRENVTLSFEPGELTHDPENDHIYITGRHVTTGPGAEPVAVERTYVVQIVVQNYRPRVMFLDVYPGRPRLSDRIDQPSDTTTARPGGGR